MWAHLTVRAYDTPYELHSAEVAGWLWPRLAMAFPSAIAACLMPDHIHIVLRILSLLAARREMAALLSGLRRSRNAGRAIRWDRVATPRILEGRTKLARNVRYVALNPCREGLTSDPLTWLWSTHRDVMGAVARPWVCSDRLAVALEQRPRHFREHHHRYVSGDPSAHAAGTVAPQPAPPSALPAQAIADLLAAAACASRLPVETVLRRSPVRRLFIELTRVHGWHDARLLGRLCGIAPRSVRRLRQRPSRPGLGAAQLCLGDDRLRSPCARQAAEFIQRRLSAFQPKPRRAYRCGAHRLRSSTNAPHATFRGQ